MRKPMPLPIVLNDYFLLNQMGYEVRFKNNKPIKVIKKRGLTVLIKTVSKRCVKYFKWYAIVTKYKLLVAIGNIKQKDRKTKGVRT